MEQGPPINVLVVDDSNVLRMLLVHLLELDPGIRVVAAVADGAAALDYLRNRRPDVVVMDIHMPGMDGFETTRRIMESQPLPIVICSATVDAQDASFAFRTMEAGAVACVQKPVGTTHPEYERMAAEIRQTVKLMSEVKVVRRRFESRGGSVSPLGAAPVPRRDGIRIVGIGASTGGPPAVQTILAALPKDFPAAILLVQHIAVGFLPGLAGWLDQTTGLRIHIAAHGVEPLPGHVYVAPDNFHMGLGAGGRIVLSKDEPEGGLRPSVAHLFRSLAEQCGSAAVGVLLTGMGTDGAAALRQMRDCGAVTIAQDRESSVVHGMPGEAIRLDAAIHILPPERIAPLLGSLAQENKTASGTPP
jgi:two-component system chemotaxis response regulator CheB